MNTLLALLVLLLLTDRRGGGLILPPASSPEDAARRAEAESERAANEAARARRTSNTERRSRRAPKPWPQTTPTGLPAFPSGWQYAEPPSPAIQQRAWQLLDELWAKGAGTTRVEKVGTEWITFRSEITRGNKRGVVAYRVKRGAPASSSTMPQASSPAPSSPRGTPVSTTVTPSGITRPVLHQGSGMGQLRAQAGHVRIVQSKIGIPNPDGMFGANTKAALIAWQGKHGLQADGIVGPQTWAALETPPLLARAS